MPERVDLVGLGALLPLLPLLALLDDAVVTPGAPDLKVIDEAADLKNQVMARLQG